MYFVLPRQPFLHCVSSADPLGLRALFAFFMFEHLVYRCKSLARVSEKKRVAAHQNHTVFLLCVVSGSGAAWLFYQRCEVDVVIWDLNSCLIPN